MKLQTKLLTGFLKGKDWDEILPDEDQGTWREILKGYKDLPEITIPRCCLQRKEISGFKIRLLCLADAAEFAGGAAVYAGKEISPGVWSCSLLAVKSKMIKEIILRNGRVIRLPSVNVEDGHLVFLFFLESSLCGRRDRE